MATSTARLEANRRNSQQSTGPKTAEGKAASRRNAFKHGLAGEGDILGPGESRELVAARAVDFARELGATGTIASVLIRRAATLSVRMERAEERNRIEAERAAAEAMAAFDAELVAEVDGWMAQLDAADPRPALIALEALPLGVARLSEAWLDLLDHFHGGDLAARQAAIRRGTRWFGRVETESGETAELDLDSPALLLALTRRIGAEIARLHEVSRTQVPLVGALDRARLEAGLLAELDPGPTPTLARRYEAAAERGVYRALREVVALDRRHDRTADLLEPIPVPARDDARPIAPPPTTQPTPKPEVTAAEPTESAPSLASFRAEPTAPLASFRAADSAPVAPRRDRPDYQTIARKIAHDRR